MSPVPGLVRSSIAVPRGATAIEYGLTAALIVVAMFAGLRNIADATTDMLDHVAREVVARP